MDCRVKPGNDEENGLALIPVAQARHALMLGAMHAAEDGAVVLDAVPMMRQPQWGQVGASAWIAHSNESKIRVRPPMLTSKLLS
jgi:hypothetical protein